MRVENWNFLLRSAEALLCRSLLMTSIILLVSSAAVAQGNEGSVSARFGVRIPMRDGVTTVADIWMPVVPGQYPAILTRTLYLRNGKDTADQAQFWGTHGYAYVVQDVRGRGDSDGSFDFMQNEGKDGYDTIEWIAAQPWSDGKVGMMGLMGVVQWLAAREHPPHLACIAPASSLGLWFDEFPYSGGGFVMGFNLDWVSFTSDRNLQKDNDAHLDLDWVYKHRSLLTMDEARGREMPLYRRFLQHDTLDDYWKRISFYPDDFRKLNIPVLDIAGWFDGTLPGAMSYWYGTSDYSPAKDQQYLLVGPWTHGGWEERKVNEMKFTPDAIYDMNKLHLAFFDRFLKGSSQKFDFPRANVYITGSNVWREFAQYPPAEGQPRKLYLHSRGSANTLIGDGSLGWNTPGQESPDHYTYNPQNPAPTKVDPLGSGSDAASDFRAIERRDDVLVYSSEELKQPLEVIGPVTVHLYAGSDATDTDFIARILDVYPDGQSLKLGSPMCCVIRARYRKGYDHTELLTPNQVEGYTINLFDIGHTFLAGHRVRIEITSSSYPWIAPNPNTGNPIATDTEWKIAHQTVYHDNKRPSYVELRVMPSAD